MTVVPQKEKRLPIDSPIPCLKEYADEMMKAYSHSPYLASVVYHCAEVAERMVYAYLNGQVKTVQVLRKRYDNYSLKKSGYICPRCKGALKHTDSFCSSCGVGLEWYG